MNVSKWLSAVVASGLVAVVGASCSANSGSSSGGQPQTGTQNGGGGGAGFSGRTGSSGSAGTGSSGTSGLGGGTSINFGPDSGQKPPPGTGGACSAITQKPEEITVYKDATVTDTIVTYSPVALMLMQDRSSSMVMAVGGSSAQSWSNSTQAVTAFVNDPASAGIDVGLEVFPPYPSNSATGDCAAGSDCGTPVVDFAPLPGNGAAIINAYTQTSPGAPGAPLLFTPTECALRGSINTCLQHQASTGEQCVVVFITDGQPTQCDTNQQDLVNIVSMARAASGTPPTLLLFTLGLPGSDINFLNSLAQAGGTNASINVSGGATAFLNALNSIRNTIVNTSVKHISTPTTISTKLDCQWKIPAAPAGQTFDKTLVNFQLTAADGTVAKYGRVDSLADCSRAGDGWYYDDNNAPTEITVCPNTCTTIKASSGATANILLGCATIIAPFN